MENSILNSASVISSLIPTTSDDVVTRMLEQHEQMIMRLGQEMQKVLNLALQEFQRIDSRFQPRILLRLRSEATNKLDALKMPPERKSYLLHQLTNCHAMEDLIDLIRQINYSQLSHRPILLVHKPEDAVDRDDLIIQDMRNDKNLEQDLLLVISGHQGLLLAKQSFSLLVGKIETLPAFSFELAKNTPPELALQLDKTNAFLQLPELVRDYQKEKVVHKVQETIAQLPPLGIRRIGIDQKISQLTEGGLLLDPHGLILTNGDHLLSGMIFQQTLETLKQKNIQLLNSSLGVIGIFDPRVAATTILLSDHVKKIIIFHHTTVDLSVKLQNKLSHLLNDLSLSEEDSPVVETIRHLWKHDSELLSFLSLPLVRQVLQVSSDLTLFKGVQASISIPSPLTKLLPDGLNKSCPLAFDLSTPYKVKFGQNLISLAEAEVRLLSELNSPRSPVLKKHILQLMQLAQAQRLELLL